MDYIPYHVWTISTMPPTYSRYSLSHSGRLTVESSALLNGVLGVCVCVCVMIECVCVCVNSVCVPVSVLERDQSVSWHGQCKLRSACASGTCARHSLVSNSSIDHAQFGTLGHTTCLPVREKLGFLTSSVILFVSDSPACQSRRR
jgi:hypothetical protein